jgi:hypothetical protein
MQEIGTNIIIITANAKRTGRPIMVETITAIDSSRRLRTVQVGSSTVTIFPCRKY